MTSGSGCKIASEYKPLESAQQNFFGGEVLKFQKPLFDMSEYEAVVETGRHFRPKKMHTPYKPGSGPETQRCGTCAFKFVKLSNTGKRFLKCGHKMAAPVTNGEGTDIKARWIACYGWYPSSPQMGKLIETVHRIPELQNLPLSIVADLLEERGDLKNAQLARELSQTQWNTIFVKSGCTVPSQALSDG